MPLYRIVQNLELGRDGTTIPAGTIDRLPTISARGIEVLTRRGVIALVQTPPLAVLPGWKTRAKRLEPAGIVTVDQFLDAPIDDIAALLSVIPGTVARWHAEIMAQLIAPAGAPRRGG